jgi:hypothetical protein
MVTNEVEVNLDRRITVLRQRCLQRKNNQPPVDGDARWMARSLRESEAEASWTIRRGQISRDILSNVELELDDLEIMVGRLAPDLPEWQMERKAAETYLQEHFPHWRTPGQSGHCQLDLSKLFTLGIHGLTGYIEGFLNQAEEDRRDVYRSFVLALQGFPTMIEHAACMVERKYPARPPAGPELQCIITDCRHRTPTTHDISPGDPAGMVCHPCLSRSRPRMAGLSGTPGSLPGRFLPGGS